MTLPFSMSLLGSASPAAVIVFSIACVLTVGLGCMARPGLTLSERRTIGRFMLYGVAVLLLVGIVIGAIGAFLG